MPPTKGQRERLKEWLELADNLHHEGAHKVDAVDHRHQASPGLLAGGGWCAGIGKAYSRREIACHVHITLDCGRENLYTQNLCARFERLPETHVVKLDGAARGAKDLDLVYKRPVRKRSCEDYHPVLVAVGELPQPVEGVSGETAVSVPSVVRLVPLDDCPMFRGDIVQRAGPTGGVHAAEIFGRGAGWRELISKGKLDLLGVSGLISPAVKARELPDEVIQGPSEVVDHVSHEKAPTTESLFREHRFSPEDVVSALVIELQAQSYSVAWRHDSTRSVDGADLALKSIAMLFGPVDLGPDAVEVGPVGHG